MSQAQPDDRGPPLPPKFLQDLLTAAILDGNINTAKTLLNHGAEPTHFDLCNAAVRGDRQLVEQIVYKGVDPNDLDSYAVRAAARAGNLDTVETLRDLGADIHGNNEEAVRNAARGDHHEVVRFLLNAGARLDHPIPSPTGGERGPSHEGLSREMAEVLRSFGDRGWDPRSSRPQPPVRRL
ncbi:MAG: hypothetical protein ABS36_08685 [Acidobacteria bacterium SCN 69-37]|nr:MAG: hypothetical protein ABS36_08685 [Acidobacteria bacterium SCN 69-37]